MKRHVVQPIGHALRVGQSAKPVNAYLGPAPANQHLAVLLVDPSEQPVGTIHFQRYSLNDNVPDDPGVYVGTIQDRANVFFVYGKITADP